MGFQSAVLSTQSAIGGAVKTFAAGNEEKKGGAQTAPTSNPSVTPTAPTLAQRQEAAMAKVEAKREALRQQTSRRQAFLEAMRKSNEPMLTKSGQDLRTMSKNKATDAFYKMSPEEQEKILKKGGAR